MLAEVKDIYTLFIQDDSISDAKKKNLTPSRLLFLAKLIYAKVQETLGTIYLMTANLPQAKTHFKRAFKIYEKIWADEPEMIEAKYQEIQELYPQIGFCIGKNLSGLLTK